MSRKWKKESSKVEKMAKTNASRMFFAGKVAANERLTLMSNLIMMDVLDPKKLKSLKANLKRWAGQGPVDIESKNSMQPSVRFPLYTDKDLKSAMTQLVNRWIKEAENPVNHDRHLRVCEGGRQIGKSLPDAQRDDKIFFSFLQDCRNNRCKFEAKCELRENYLTGHRFSFSGIHVCPLLKYFQHSVDKEYSLLALETLLKMTPRNSSQPPVKYIPLRKYMPHNKIHAPSSASIPTTDKKAVNINEKNSGRKS